MYSPSTMHPFVLNLVNFLFIHAQSFFFFHASNVSKLEIKHVTVCQIWRIRRRLVEVPNNVVEKSFRQKIFFSSSTVMNHEDWERKVLYCAFQFYNILFTLCFLRKVHYLIMFKNCIIDSGEIIVSNAMHFFLVTKKRNHVF